MNKSQLLDRSRELGKEIVQLVNEYRNSTGEDVDHDEQYFEDYFAGIIAFLCTGDGEARIEYNKAHASDEESFIDGEIIINADVQYMFNETHIHDFLRVIEHISHKEGRIDKTYTKRMDPITYMYYLMGTDYSGNKIFDGADVHATTI